MSRERILEVVLTMLGAVLLLIASVGKHPYGFYMLLRLVITVGAVYWAWRVYKARLRAWTWIFVAVALLLNPFLPIRMQRAQWQPIDLCLGVLLIGWSGYWLFRKRPREFEVRRLAQEKAKEINGAHQVLSDPQKRRLYDQQLDAYQQTRAPQQETPTSSQDGQAYQWPLYSIAWTAVCLLLVGGLLLPVSSLDDTSWVVIVLFLMILAGIQAWYTDSTLYRIAWTAVCLLLGVGFSLAVSSSDSGLGLIVVSAMAFGSFVSAALLWSRAISKVLSKIGITTFARQAMVTGALIICAIHGLDSIGSVAARSSTPENQLRTSVSGTSAALRKAAEQGDAHAQYDLGVLYYEEWEGHGLPQDDTQAAFWCRTIRAWRTWINSADPYNRRYTQAVFWYRKAAEQGDADAQDALGNLYYDGHGPLSMQLIMYGHNGQCAQAALWYRKAAEQGDADAQLSLGYLYDDGQGVPQDYAEAYFWYDLAAAGAQDASASNQVAKFRDEAASHLTPADLSHEQERVQKWVQAHPAKPQ